MRPIPAAELRERFLRFFEARGHQRMASDSLVPANDPTLLFTGAGMNQFKDMFLGRGSLPHKRVTTAQKCLRVPDLENVGATPRHHTFFEMLGHFSFGDYFKKECIRWEWEFFTQELGFPAEQLVVTVYEDDDEAFGIWRDDVGLPEERIYRFGEKENFWPAEAPSKGPNGPCGPCSELYFDNAPGEPLPAREGLKSLPDGRFTEVGNCVFTQFDRQDGGVLAPLPQKNIDVGLGLERIAAVLAGVPNNFGTDLFQPYIAHLEGVTGKKYGDDPRDDTRMRRIADHVRAVIFCISDGALPANEGRGYVVRKILRRAARDGFDLGVEGSFLHRMVDVVGAVMGDAYPEVRAHAAQCRSVIRAEEDGFASVYRQGMQRLRSFLGQHAGGGELAARGQDPRLLEGSGEFAFQLHDTYGFPVDITRQVLLDHGFGLDEQGFEAAMTAQRERARAAMATSEAVFAENAAMVLRDAGHAGTTFVGYDVLSARSVALALLAGNEARTSAGVGEELTLVVECTPFYAQGGGQVGDRGVVRWEGGTAAVTDTTSLDGYWLHHIRVTEGTLSAGTEVELEVDGALRRATERNHTATHLLHAALKRQIGDHVSQAGSEVGPERLRFDYTHGERLTDEQVAAIEDEVNAVVMDAIDVVPAVRSLADARASGFVAMFGEKYGDEVRTLSVGDYSRELCGGTHVRNSGNIGSFRIVHDVAVSAGTRRIEAVTGSSSAEAARRDRLAMAGLAHRLKVPVAEVAAKVDSLVADLKQTRKDLEKATAADLGAVLTAIEAIERSGPGLVFEAPKLDMKELQDLLTRVRQKLEPVVAVVFSASEDGVLVGAAVTKDLVSRIQAGGIVRELASVLGGGGGGKPEQAQGKGKDAAKLPEAVAQARKLLADAGL
ncbi:MAG: alanine--tRNA ligase [Planctomycetota bacterium]|nr:alanine--tRNA ligase [Planctomycetota bacterium]MDA1221220.1 alanine--tRNA ligase [Planctomycetota bacterium]